MGTENVIIEVPTIQFFFISKETYCGSLFLPHKKIKKEFTSHLRVFRFIFYFNLFIFLL